MKIEILNLKANYFKNLKNIDFNFANYNVIEGENGTGKTSIYDAFLWVLFGKNSENEKDFTIKTVDKEGKSNKNEITEVELLLNIDNNNVLLKCEYIEKWVKKRGSNIANFEGFKTLYYINNVPTKLKDYTVYINNIIDSELFKILTNPAYFNGLNWKIKRDILINNLTDFNENDFLTKNYKSLSELINNTSIEDYLKILTHKRKKINEKLTEIPIKITENTLKINTELNFKEISSEITRLENEKTNIENNLFSINQSNNLEQQERDHQQNKINNLIDEKNNIEYQSKNYNRVDYNKYNTDVLKIENNLNTNKDLLNIKKSNIERFTVQLLENEKQRNLLRNDFFEVKDEVLKIDNNLFVCPTCNQALPTDDQQTKTKTITNNFNIKKADNLELIQKQGIELKKTFSLTNEIKQNLISEIETIKENIILDKSKLEKLTSKEVVLKDKNYKNDVKYISLTNEINILQQAKNTKKQDVKTTDLIKQKSDLENIIFDLKISLNVENLNNDFKTRILELEKQESFYINELNKNDSIFNDIQDFTKDKINIIEQTINNHFTNVKVKMFKKQINEGLKEVCDVFVDGVVFSNLNTAKQINTGIEIINVLSTIKNTNTPLFIDNAERITNVLKTENQIVKLYVKENKKLQIHI